MNLLHDRSPTSEIVERLESLFEGLSHERKHVSANIAYAAFCEINRLSATIERLGNALEPFAKAVGHEKSDPDDARRPDWLNIWEMPEATNISLGDLREARATLTAAKERHP